MSDVELSSIISNAKCQNSKSVHIFLNFDHSLNFIFTVPINPTVNQPKPPETHRAKRPALNLSTPRTVGPLTRHFHPREKSTPKAFQLRIGFRQHPDKVDGWDGSFSNNEFLEFDMFRKKRNTIIYRTSGSKLGKK